MKLSQLFPLVLMLLLIGCQNRPKFINHTQPNWAVDFAPFWDAGCPADEYGRFRCQPESPLAEFGCYEIEEPSDLLGALDPAYPLAVCVIAPGRQSDTPHIAVDQIREEESYIYWTSGLDPRFYRYVIYDGTDFQLLQTKADFQNIFAPIETPEEALSYTLALTNRRAYYDLTFDKELEYFVDEIEDTHVQTNEDGYLVHLFGYQEFGCGPHNTYNIDTKLSRSGELTDLERINVYKDPADDGLCID